MHVHFYTIPEVAQILRCSPRTVHAMIHDQRLPAIIIGKNRYRIPHQALLDFLHTPSSEEDSFCDGISVIDLTPQDGDL